MTTARIPVQVTCGVQPGGWKANEALVDGGLTLQSGWPFARAATGALAVNPMSFCRPVTDCPGAFMVTPKLTIVRAGPAADRSAERGAAVRAVPLGGRRRNR
jgi:hypothetical protein